MYCIPFYHWTDWTVDSKHRAACLIIYNVYCYYHLYLLGHWIQSEETRKPGKDCIIAWSLSLYRSVYRPMVISTNWVILAHFFRAWGPWPGQNARCRIAACLQTVFTVWRGCAGMRCYLRCISRWYLSITTSGPVSSRYQGSLPACYWCNVVMGNLLDTPDPAL